MGKRLQDCFASLTLKHGFVLLLVFSAFFHFIIPYFYYEFHGFETNYQTANRLYFNSESYILGMFINVTALVLAAVIIWFLPSPQPIEKKPIRFANAFYLISIFWSFVVILCAGGFQGILAGNLNGSWINYIGLFLGSGSIFILTLGYLRNSSINIVVLSYLAVALLSGSRSAPIVILVSGFVLLAAKATWRQQRKYIILTVFAAISSVAFFRVANIIRNTEFSKEAGQSSDGTFGNFGDFGNFTNNIRSGASRSLLFEESDAANGRNLLSRIVGRASMLETSMLPIMFKNAQVKASDSAKLETFYQKYSLSNQLSLFSRYFFPRFAKNLIQQYFPNAFSTDVLPNQYYRYVFMEETLEQVQSHYTSVNITFPIYLYMYSNAIVAIFGYVLALVLWYLLISRLTSRFPIIALIVFSNVYTFIYFFDLTDYLVTLLRAFLTAFAFCSVYFLINKYFPLTDTTNPRPEV